MGFWGEGDGDGDEGWRGGMGMGGGEVGGWIEYGVLFGD